jgi:hypothetical protein
MALTFFFALFAFWFGVDSYASVPSNTRAPDIRVLFLGGPVDPGGCCHIPYPRFTRLDSVMAKVGIRVNLCSR